MALGDDGRHRFLDALPFLRRVVEHAAAFDDLVDMRLAVELARVQPPDGGEGAVVEAQAAARREHRHAFAQRVERFPLHLDQRVVPAFQREPFGDVLVEIGHAGLALAVGDDVEGAAVGQVPLVLDLRIRAVTGEPALLPVAVIGLLRQPPCLAEAIEDLAVAGMGCEPFGVELPQLDIGLIEMGEPLLGIEHGEGRGQPVEAPEARFHARSRLAGCAVGPMRFIEQPAQRADLLLELAMPGGDIGEFQPPPDQIAHLEHDGPAHGAAVDLDIALPGGAEHQVERLAPLHQPVDGVVELARPTGHRANR